MNASDWRNGSSLGIPPEVESTVNVLVDAGTTSVLDQVSDRPCGEAFSAQTPAAAVQLPGSLDALLYIVIVLMFYAMSIVVLMVKYVRREREEASLRNYYHEFVSRDKFSSAQYKNRQIMRRIFGRGHGSGNKRRQAEIVESCEVGEIGGENHPSERKFFKKEKTPQTVSRNGNTFSRLLVESEDQGKVIKEKSFKFLGAKSQFCKKGFFGKRFCNKQLCSECVSENAPTIDWDEGRNNSDCGQGKSQQELVAITVYTPRKSPPSALATVHFTNGRDHLDLCPADRDDLFLPIIECDSEKETSDNSRPCLLNPQPQRTTGDVSHHRRRRSHDLTSLEEHALVSSFSRGSNSHREDVSSCSLEVSELLANVPPLGANSNDLDTLDGLSNLDSETESQSLLNYSSSFRGCNWLGRESGISPGRKSEPGGFRVSGEGEREKTDTLSERTSLLSCTLSLDDCITNSNLSSSKLPSSNGFVHLNNNNYHSKKNSFKNNGKSFLPSLPKPAESEEEEMMQLLNDITMMTEDTGVFRNLKYFLRSFSRNEPSKVDDTSVLLSPKETYFGPGSPKSMLGQGTSREGLDRTADDSSKRSERALSEVGSLDCGGRDSSEKDALENPLGERWAYTYDTEDELYSDGDQSSSFGDYYMGETTQSQVIDLSKPLTRRDIDAELKAGLSRAFIGLSRDPWLDDQMDKNKTNPMLAGYGPARKETKV